MSRRRDPHTRVRYRHDDVAVVREHVDELGEVGPNDGGMLGLAAMDLHDLGVDRGASTSVEAAVVREEDGVLVIGVHADLVVVLSGESGLRDCPRLMASSSGQDRPHIGGNALVEDEAHLERRRALPCEVDVSRRESRKRLENRLIVVAILEVLDDSVDRHASASEHRPMSK